MVTWYLGVMLFLQTLRFGTIIGTIIGKLGLNSEANADVVINGSMIIFTLATLFKHLGRW